MLSRFVPADVEVKSTRDWRWVVGGAGKVLIALGVLMFGFVGYQLWGTGIETELAQRELEDDFDRLLAQNFDTTRPVADASPASETLSASTSASEPTDAADDADSVEDRGPVGQVSTVRAVPISDQRLPELTAGSALSRLEVPAIGIDDIIVAGIGVSDLKKGPGHFPDTPLPGQLGNAAIAGHRTTYGAPFFDIDQLEAGDEIIVTTLDGRYVYQVSGQQIVEPSEYEVVATSDPERASLTLVSCDPKFTAQNRIVVRAELDADRSGPVGEALLDYGQSPSAPRSGDAELPVSAPEVGSGDEPVDRRSESTPVTGATETSTPASVATADDGQLGDRAAASEESSGLADAFEQGWFSDPAANVHVGAWGVSLGFVAAAAMWVTRRSGRDLVGAAVGFVPFVVTLYFFYQNVNRLLPPGL